MINFLKFERPKQYPQDEILNEEDRLVRSWASVEVRDKQGDIVPINEMKRVLNTWFKRGATMMDQHSNRPIGRGLRWQEAEHPQTEKPGVIIDYQVFDDYTVDNDVWDDIKSGKRTGLSIGGRATGEPEVKMDTFSKKPGNYLSGLELYEISPVDSPANQFGKNIAINYLAKSDKEADSVELAKRLMKDLSKGFAVKNIDKPFAGFQNMDECMQAQMQRGHSDESAKRISNFLMHQTNKEWAEDSKIKPKETLNKGKEPGVRDGTGPLANSPNCPFNPEQLAEGIRVEMEHTDDPKVAEKIARDHLMEDPQYYSKLKLIEKCDKAIKKKENNPEADKETEEIKESAKTCKYPHKFKAAKWTHPNGHPRCRICGQEERVDDTCEKPIEKQDKTDIKKDVSDTIFDALSKSYGPEAAGEFLKSLQKKTGMESFNSLLPGIKKDSSNLEGYESIADLRNLANFKHIAHSGSDEQYYDLYFANDEYFILDEGVTVWRSSDTYPDATKKKWKELTGEDITLNKVKDISQTQKNVKKNTWSKEFVKALLKSSTTKSNSWSKGFVKECQQSHNLNSRKDQTNKSGNGGKTNEK